MGVDFYACENCGHTFPDCGDYFGCECGAIFCSSECGVRISEEVPTGDKYADGEDKYEDRTTCSFCRLENLADHEMIPFLLNKLGLTREQAVDMFRKENESKEDGE
jgi:hypothetical protein